MIYFLTISDDVVSGLNPVAFILHIPPLEGGNYRVWREKYELALALSKNDLALTSPCPTEPVDLVREENEFDTDFTVGSEIMQKCGWTMISNAKNRTYQTTSSR